MGYTERALAFMDILGMRLLVERIGSDEVLRLNLHDALRLIKSHERYTAVPSTILSKMRVSVFSDCIALSSEPEELAYLVYVCSTLQNQLLLLGHSVRGGIAIGRTFHEDGLLYGEGIVRAYDLEHTHAENPRILLAEGLERRLPEKVQDEYLDADVDRRLIVAPFMHTPYIGGAEDLASEGYDPRHFFLAEARRHLVVGIKDSEGKPHHEKMRWLASRFNMALKKRPCFPEVHELKPA